MIVKVAQRWKTYVGPQDERVEAESNRIYKVGFVMLSFGVLVYMYYDWSLKQAMYMRDVLANGTGRVELTTADLFLFGWVLLTMVVGAVPLCRKGFADDNRFAEAEKFPTGYYVLVSIVSVICVDVLAAAIRIAAEFQVLGAEGIMWSSVAFGGAFLIIVGIPFFLLVFWTSFKTAQSRRKQLELRFDE